MPSGHEKTIEKKIITHPLSKAASLKALVGPAEGWDSHVMRVLELEKGGYSPHHEHPWPHINYVLEGEGTLMIGDEEHPLVKGSYAYVPGNTVHQFRNNGDEVFKFICIVPTEGHQ